MEGFRERILRVASESDSRIILAYDKNYLFKEGYGDKLFRETLSLFNSLRGYIVGVKIGLPTLLSLGEEGIYRLINEYDWGFIFIADLKTADVDHINRVIVDHLADIGFDALIAHSIIGYEGGLRSIVEEARKYGMGVFALLAMTHKGAEDILNKNFNRNLEVSLKSDVDGFILPANRRDLIRITRERVGDKLIASPGIGAQGSEPGSAVNAGADFEIIGRAIYMSDNPFESAKRFREVLRWKHG